MGFKEVTSLDADVTTALGGKNKKTGKPNPKSVEGYYLGSRKVESKKSKSGFAFIHFLQTAEGNIGVWGKTDLDRKIAGVTPGTMIRATHTGMQATPNGEMYKYKVEVDEDNTIEVSAAESLSSSEDTDDGNEDAYGEDDQAAGGYDEESENNSAALVASSKSAQERAARVQALLKGKKA